MSSFCGSCGTPRVQPPRPFCTHCGAALAPVTDPGPVSQPAQTPTAPAPAWQQPVTPQYGGEQYGGQQYGAPPYAAQQHAAHQYPPGGPQDPGVVPEYAVPARPDGPRRKAPFGRILAVGGVVLALAGAGVVGVQLLSHDGGAGSPEDAASQFVSALAEQDGVGALDVVAPGEVSGLGDLYTSAQSQLADHQLVGKDKLTDAMSVSVDGLAFDVDQLGDHAARVSLTQGTYTVTYDPSKVPADLAFVRDAYPDKKTWTGDLAREADSFIDDATDGESDHASVMTVEIDGRWYVTALGTALDYATPELEDEGAPAPDFSALDADVAPIVGKDPEEVVANLVDAVNKGDVDDLLANLPADLVTGLRPYAASAQYVLDKYGVHGEVSASDLDLSTKDLGGDLVEVTIDHASLSGSYSDNEGYDNGSGNLEIDHQCATAIDDEGYSDQACLGPDERQYGVDAFTFVIRKVDGGYQLDPLATATRYASNALSSAPDSFYDELKQEVCYDFQETSYDAQTGEFTESIDC